MLLHHPLPPPPLPLPLQLLLLLPLPLPPLPPLPQLPHPHRPPPPTLLSFSCIHSLRRLTGVWLSKLHNLTDLTVSDTPISASGPSIFLSGSLPKSWHQTLTHDLSVNLLKGEIHPSIGDLIDLKNLSLSSNSLSSPIPDSLSSLSSLVYLDLSSNQLNGSIPGFLAEMKDLKYLNLENNNFQGAVPFNGSFIKSLVVFKIGENSNLCYNTSAVSSKVKLGISPCDKNGLPMSPPGAKSDSSTSNDPSNDSSGDLTSQKCSGHHGPTMVVLGIAIAFASVIFSIVFLIFLAKPLA